MRGHRFGWLVPHFAPPTPGQPEAYQFLRRNWQLYVGGLTFWFAGMSFFSANTILTVFAFRLTESTLVVSLIPAMFDAGWFVPSLFMARLVEGRQRVKPLSISMGAAQRVFYLALAVSVWWLADLPRDTARWVFLALVAAMSLGNGLPTAPSTELLARLLPLAQRGRLLGSALVFGQLFSVGGAQVAALLLAGLDYPGNFGLVFLTGAVCMWASLTFGAFYHEPASAPAAARPGGPYGRRLMQILQQNPNLRQFLLSRAAAYLGGMPVGFIAVYAVERFDVPDSTAAIFALILYASSMVGYGLWGGLGDRRGYRRVLILATPLWLAALLVLLVSGGVWACYLAFGLLGLASAAAALSDLTMTMEFAPDDERPTYYALARTLTAPALLLAPLLGGWIIRAWGYPAMFGAALALTALSLALLVLVVREPRQPQPAAAG